MLEASSVRHGNILKLKVGEVPFMDCSRPTLVSTEKGVRIVTDVDQYFSNSRAAVHTFEISKTYKVRDVDFFYRKSSVLNDIHLDFEKYEVDRILQRMNTSDDVVYAETEEVQDLKKLFAGLGKKVAVLPNGTIADLGKRFTLWVRVDLTTETSRSDVDLSTQITLWENVGFSYDLD